MGTSEIAQIRQRIDQEIASMHHAKRYAAVARHDAITHHFDRLGACFEELKGHMGDQEAVALLMEQMERGDVC